MKVVNGRTGGKNRHVPTSHKGYVIDRASPGRGYRHVVTKRDLQSFIDLIPDWASLSRRLERITLAEGNAFDDGYYAFYHREKTGAIALHAWDADLWMPLPIAYVSAHQTIFDQLGVSREAGNDRVVCRFTEAQARAFILLHVFLHELGHHWDRIHQRHRRITKGEPYAERFAHRRFEEMLPDYVRAFGDPTRAQ